MVDDRERYKELLRKTPEADIRRGPDGEVIVSAQAQMAFQQRLRAPRVVNGGEDLDYGAMGAQRTVNVDEINVYDINWPAEPFGFKHAEKVSVLAVHIAMDTLAIKNPNELNALRFAAMFHDVGRQHSEWQVADPGHGQRSASMLERIMQRRNDPTSLIERAVRLVAEHDLSRTELPRDPLLMALWDADSLAAARFDPGLPTGARIFRQRMARVCTAYPKRAEVREVAMREGGWRL